MSDNPFAYGTGPYGDYFYGKDPYNSMSGEATVSISVPVPTLQRVRPFSGAMQLAVEVHTPVLWRVRPFSGAVSVSATMAGSMILIASMAGVVDFTFNMDGDSITVTPLWNPVTGSGVWTPIEETNGLWVPVSPPSSPWS